MRSRIGRHPDYKDRPPEDKDKITGGIWQNYSDEAKQRITRQTEKAFFAIMNVFKDFGGTTSMNADWERGYREGERKTEDRTRGIPVQRDRQAQFAKKAQQQHVAYGSNPKNPVQQEQRSERQEALRYRAGQKKEQHQGLGKVPVVQDRKPWQPFESKPVEKVFEAPEVKNLTPRSVLFMPTMHLKSIAEDVKGDVYVEGTVSMPLKDLQGDLLEVPALVQAKNAMVTPPNDLVWLDHFSPYAKPEAGSEPPIGRFVKSAILSQKSQDGKEYPALWAKMLMNKAHPKFKETLYELKNKFRNAFSMEFVPVREGLKMVQGKIVNSISEIKYFATSLVRAPANEGATISKVYVRAFANSSKFCPVRVKGLGWIGQTVMEKKSDLEIKEAEPEEEPEDEPEEEPEEEPETKGTLKRRDYDRQTGSTAAERHSTAMGEWGDPALDKSRASLKSPLDRLDAVEKMLAVIGKNMAIMGKSLGITGLKGIDEDTTEALGETDGVGIDDEQEPGEVKHGKMGAPKKQRIITTFDGPDLPGEEVEGQDISTKALYRFIAKTVNDSVAKAVDRKTVFRKDSFNEDATPKTKSVERMKLIEADDGSIESQLAIMDEFRSD